MAQVRGTSTVLCLATETTYGTAATGNFVKIFHAGETVRAVRPLIDSQTIKSGRVQSTPIPGNWDVVGEIRTEINCESMMYLLNHAIEATATKTGSSAPYTFVYEPDSLSTSFTLEKDFGSDISGAGRVTQLLGCRIAGFSMEFPQEGYPMATWRVIGARPTLPQPSALTDSTPATIGTHQPFAFYNCNIYQGGTVKNSVQSIRFDVDNQIEAMYAIGGAGTRVSAPEGFCRISGEMTAIFDSADFINSGLNSGETNITIELSRGDGDGSATGDEKLTILLDDLKFEPTLATVESPGGLIARLPFKAYVGTDGPGFRVTALVPNDLSTYPAGS